MDNVVVLYRNKLPELVPQVIVPLVLHTNPIAPLVSVLIPVYGQHATTFACLKSIAEHPLRRAFEVIVMDDCFSAHSRALSRITAGSVIGEETMRRNPSATPHSAR